MVEEFEMELVKKAQDGEEEARLALLSRFNPLIRKLCTGEDDWEDLKEELILEFLERLAAYDRDSGIYFPYYIRRYLCWKKVKHIRDKRKRLGYETLNPEDLEGEEMEMEKKPTMEEILAKVDFSDKEMEFLRLTSAGLLPGEIMKQCHMTRERYYRTRKRVVEKVREKWRIK